MSRRDPNFPVSPNAGGGFEWMRVRGMGFNRVVNGSPIPQSRRDEALADINRFITHPDDLRQALRQLESLSEYSPDDESVCTYAAALDNCEQLKGYFPGTAPESVLENIDAIEGEIRRSKREDNFSLGTVLMNPKAIAFFVVVAAVLWMLAQFVPRN